MMHHPKKGIKGFALRRRGRPAGSRAVDRNQTDLFPGVFHLHFPAAKTAKNPFKGNTKVQFKNLMLF